MCYPEACLPSCPAYFMVSPLTPPSSQHSSALKILPTYQQVRSLLTSESNTYSCCTKDCSITIPFFLTKEEDFKVIYNKISYQVKITVLISIPFVFDKFRENVLLFIFVNLKFYT